MEAAAPALVRRLGAAFYDLLVVVALWMLVYFPLVAAGLIQGSADDSFDPAHLALRGGIAFAYFGWCWTRGGATLGAQAWKLAVVRRDGAPLDWLDAARRFGVALGYLIPLVVIELVAPGTQSGAAFWPALLVPFLLGLAASRYDAEGRALHERLLETRLVHRPIAPVGG